MLREKDGTDSPILKGMGIYDIEKMMWYEIKVWFDGRRLAPNKWKDEVDIDVWRKSIKDYNAMTEVWLRREDPSEAVS